MEGEDGGYTEVRRTRLTKQPLQLIIVHDGTLHRVDGQDTVKAPGLLLPLLLLCLSAFLHHLFHIGQTVEGVTVSILFGFLSEMLEDILTHNPYSSRIVQSLIRINTPHLFSVHVALHAHRRTVVHMERQHVLVSDGIDDGIGMQSLCRLAVLVRFSAKQLCRRLILTSRTCIDGEDGCSREAKHHVFLDPLGDDGMHIAKLASVALVEYQHDILFGQNLAQFLVLVPEVGLHQVRQFLDGRDDDGGVIILDLLQQNLG